MLKTKDRMFLLINCWSCNRNPLKVQFTVGVWLCDLRQCRRAVGPCCIMDLCCSFTILWSYWSLLCILMFFFSQVRMMGDSQTPGLGAGVGKVTLVVICICMQILYILHWTVFVNDSEFNSLTWNYGCLCWCMPLSASVNWIMILRCQTVKWLYSYLVFMYVKKTPL